MRIGVLRGRENSFPDAFIAKVNSMGKGVTAEFVQLGAQWCWVATLACLAAIVWNRGLARFSAVSG